MESFPITFHVALCKTRELPQIWWLVVTYSWLGYLHVHVLMYSRHLNDPLTCLVAHKASKESFHFSRLAAVVFTSSHDCHPAFALSFSTVLLRVVFGTHDVYVIFLATCAMLPLLYSVFTFQFLIFLIFLGCIGCLFSSVVSCCLWPPRIIESPLL